MTANQISYWQVKEQARSNRVKEAETQRSNIANETLTRMQRDETMRHNLATEGETNRANTHNIINSYVKSANDVLTGFTQRKLNTARSMREAASVIGDVVKTAAMVG